MDTEGYDPRAEFYSTGPVATDPSRRWYVTFIPDDRSYIALRHHIIELADGETDNAPTHSLPWAMWLQKHAEYGLDVDGEPVEAA